MDSSSSSSSDSQAGSPVPWQTAFWTLVALAINTMAQPSGKVCGLPSRFRTYLRGSPIVCLADSLSILIRLCVTSLHLRISPRQSLQMLLQQRFSDTLADAEPGSDNDIRTIEKMTWLRWLFFILGTLPSSIKLMAMGSVPWTKAWGMMFLSSFLLVEILLICSSIMERDPARGRPASTSRTENVQMKLVMKHADRTIIVVTFLLQISAFYWVQCVIVRTFWWHDLSLPFEQGLNAISSTMRHVTAVCTFAFSLITSLVVIVQSPVSPLLAFALAAAFYILMFLIGLLFQYVDECLMAELLFFTHLLSLIALNALVQKLKPLELVCLMNRSSARDLNFDWQALLIFYLFVSIVVYTILGYAFVYDPTGTSNPTWTSIFG